MLKDVADRTTSYPVLEAALSPSHERFSEHAAFNALFSVLLTRGKFRANSPIHLAEECLPPGLPQRLPVSLFPALPSLLLSTFHSGVALWEHRLDRVSLA